MGISFPGLLLEEKGNRFFGLPVFLSRCISTAHTGSFSGIIGIPQTPSGLVSFATRPASPRENARSVRPPLCSGGSCLPG